MVQQNITNIEDYIALLNMNGLQGRMLRMPAPLDKKREILFIYGHHSNIERWWGLIQELNLYGTVTVPDLPGFGGMQSMYKIGEKPTLDALADYLAAFVKLRYKRRRVTIVGHSFGFLVVTRMLQRYPDIAKKVDVLVSVVGFAHRDDFILSKSRQRLYRAGAMIFSKRIPAWFFRLVCLQPFVLRRVYDRSSASNEKLTLFEQDFFRQTIDLEIKLWHDNEVRTFMTTASTMLNVDNCQTHIDLPVWHVSVRADRYFDNQLVEQHLKVIFSSFHHIKAKVDVYDPRLLTDAKTVPAFIPPKLRRELARS